MTEQESRRGKSRRERVEFARSRDILDVANELQMELVRSGRDYRWKEHDSLVISPDKNLWKWFSRNTGGDAISLVETIKEVDFNQSVDFLNDGNFKEFQMVERAQEDFKYYLEKYEQPFSAGRDYLRNQRGLSDETIDYFLEQGVLAQANAKLDYFAEGTGGVATNAIEPVIVFKSLSSSGEVVGASLQGIQENWEKWPKHGYAKVIMKNSDPMTGIHVDIGTPKRLIFTESPIDLMSYYELHKDSLQDVRLVSMDGLKESTIGRHLSQIQAEISGKPLRWTPEQMADGLQVAIDHHFFEDGKNADLITLALDNDKAGRTFIQELEAKGAVINSDLPELKPGQDKTDWNDVLKNQQEEKPDSRKSEYEQMAEETLSESSHLPDTSHLSPEDAEWLKENWNNISFSVQSTRPSETDLAAEEKHSPGNQESIGNIEENAGRVMSYEEVKQENEALTKRLNNRIQSGELSIEFSPDFYLYDVFAKLGNSHPTKYLNDKRMEVLSPIHSLLSSIDERTVDLYKKKGTPEQDSLYQALKPHQRALGVDISTRFIGELAIAAYNTNKQIESLSSDSFGVYFGERTLDNLSQSIERMLEYPLIESGTRDFTYGFVTTPNTLFHYLDEQEGEVVLNRELLDNLMSRLDTHPVKIMEVSEEKAPEKSQELDMIFEQQKNERTSGSLGSLQPEAEGSPTPVPKAGTFERSVTSRPTTSSHLLYFTINEEFQSSNDGYYHSISLDELTKLNRPIRRLALQNAAQYYLDELANSKIYYVTPDKTVQVHFEEKHFMHLTGIKPIALGQTPEKTLHDFAEGNGHFDNILLANNDAAFDKLKVLSDLSVATESTSFYFDDLTDLRRYDGRFDSLIKSDDKDIILLFKELEEENYIPISVFKSRTKLTKELETVDKTPILGVFRERDGRIEQLSINEDYVKDRGNELQTILKDGLFEEIKLEEQVHNKQELKRDADADGISDEEELLQGTNPYDFRLKPGSKPEVEESLQADEVVLAAASLAVADFIQNKDMAGLSRHLKEGIKEFLDSDKYKDYLTKMSHLNNYSNRNLRLILAQNPEARQVASFKQWKENFDRYVKKGEKALRIFKPMTKIKKDENNQPILDKNGKPETVTFFGLVPVFDVSQTEGKEMPKAAEVKEQLTDLDYANLYRALMAIAKENDVSVRFEEMENNKHGYYSVPENQIVLRSNDMNKAQIIKTFLHEMAHAELHHADNPQKENLTRSTAELQAESVAYVVSSYYGIDTSEYSFNYLSGWSADKETLADLEAQLDIVQQEAKSLMVRMDQALEQLRLSQEKQTKRSFEQKLENFKDQSKQDVEDHKQELKADAQSKKEKGFSK